MIQVKAHAKVNLSLNITGEKDGYHQLKSVVASIDLADTIVLSKRKLSRIAMHGMGSEGIPPEKNNALKAAELYSETFGTEGAEITVYKDIPMGGGLGGSSADAAGVLKGMQKLYKKGTDEEIKALADSLGSDTGYLLKGGYALLEGRGEIVTPLSAKQPLSLLLFLPEGEVSTPQCYRAYDTMPDRDDGQTERVMDALSKGDLKGLGENLYNSLTKPALSLNPKIAEAIEEAKSFAPLGVGMSGSGSTVFALFENREFCEWAKSRYRGKCRLVVTKTVLPGDKKEWRNPFCLSEDEMKSE